MNWLTSFLTAFCAAGVCFGALFVICPDGKMSRSVKYLISICFLVVIIILAGVNIKKANFDFEFDVGTNTDIDEIQESVIEQAFSVALKRAEIDFKEITVFADNLPDGSIKINKITIITDSHREKVITALGGEREDFTVEVINE